MKVRRKERFQIENVIFLEQHGFSLLSPKSINSIPFHTQGYLDLGNKCVVFLV